MSAQALFEPEIPAHAQNDDFTVEVSTFEQPVHALQLPHCRSPPGQACQPIRLRCTICTRALSSNSRGRANLTPPSLHHIRPNAIKHSSAWQVPVSAEMSARRNDHGPT